MQFKGWMPDQNTMLHFAAATLLGAAGWWVNGYSIALFSDTQLILGNAFVLLCASQLGVRWGLWCALLAVSGLGTDSPVMWALFGLEAFFVARFCFRGWYLLYADMFYWCLIGMPLAALVLYMEGLPADLISITVLGHGFNGLLYGALAAISIILLPRRWLRPFRRQPRFPRTFKQKLTHSVLVVVSAVLMLALSLSSIYQKQLETKILAGYLKEGTDYYEKQVERKLQSYRQALVSAANGFVSLDDYSSRSGTVLLQLKQYYPAFDSVVTMTPNDDGAETQRSSTPHLDFKVNNASPLELYAPIPVLKFDGNVWLKANINIAALELSTLNTEFGRVEAIIRKPTGRVLWSTNNLKFPVGTAAELLAAENKLSNELDMVASGRQGALSDYFHRQTHLADSLELHVLIDHDAVISRMEDFIRLGVALMLVAVFVALLLARTISAHLSRPMEALVNQLASREREDQRLMPLDPVSPGTPVELKALFNELERNRVDLHAYQRDLENQVASRTAELQEANAKLAQQAYRDGLTGCYNRRYFDDQFEVVRQHCVRSKGQLALALIDIDFFKRINDTYGHLVGDDCLKGLVDIIQRHFSRKVDLLARYGGEEFVLLVPEINQSDMMARLESLRRTVNDIPLAMLPDNKPVLGTVSIGLLVDDPNSSEEYHHWLKLADDALYRAKQNGRNCIEVVSKGGLKLVSDAS